MIYSEELSYTIKFLTDVNITLLENEPYFDEFFNLEYFRANVREGVFSTTEHVSVVSRKVAETLKIAENKIVIEPTVPELRGILD